MLTHGEIRFAVEQVANRYPIKKASYFGSYANGTATDTSDLDLLLEFNLPRVSLLVLSAIKIELEEMLNIPIDVIRVPFPKDSLLEFQKVVHVYG